MNSNPLKPSQPSTIRTRRRRPWMLARLVVVAAVLAGCSAPASGPGAEGATIRVATLGILADAPFYVARSEGYFEEAGINVEIESYSSTPDLLPSLATGEVDVAWGGFAAGLIRAVGREIPVSLVASHARAVPETTTVLFARGSEAPGERPELRDLLGGTVAVNAPGNALHAYLFEALTREGLDPNQVEVRSIPFPDMPAALASRTVDGAITVDPLTTIVQDRHLGVEVTNGYDMWGEAHDVGLLMYSPQFAEERAPAEAFMVAYLRAQRLIHEAYTGENASARERVLRAVEANIPGIEDATATRVFLNSGNPDGYIDRSSIDRFTNTFARMGMLDDTSDVNLEGRVDDSYVDAALEDLGRYSR